MNAHVTLTQRELLSLSPEVRAQYREATTQRRQPNKEGQTVSTSMIEEIEDEPEPEPNPTLAPMENLIQTQPPTRSVHFAGCQHRSPPVGATVLSDPYDSYYRSLGPGKHPDPDQLIVAKESASLRSVYALVDNMQKVECVLDGGCQIIAMSEEVCHDLSVSYDPTVILRMQSANGSIDNSLSLARNVPFLIGDLTVYMQVHVICAPAYDILLGRPFDVLTESVIRNYRNEDQTITIHDPNSGRVTTIPTLPRGPARAAARHFHNSQNFRK